MTSTSGEHDDVDLSTHNTLHDIDEASSHHDGARSAHDQQQIQREEGQRLSWRLRCRSHRRLLRSLPEDAEPVQKWHEMLRRERLIHGQSRSAGADRRAKLEQDAGEASKDVRESKRRFMAVLIDVDILPHFNFLRRTTSRQSPRQIHRKSTQSRSRPRNRFNSLKNQLPTAVKVKCSTSAKENA